MNNRCPRCTSEKVYFSKKKGIWICEECELEFAENDSSKSVSAHKNLDSAEYWAYELWKVAPTALALSYHQLHEYVKEQNIGCTLFVIRDVFELMIKVPVTIIFNGIHELNKDNENFDVLLASNTKVAKLYEYSMQMLSTGKWWECVRLASDLDESTFASDSTVEHTKLYADTIGYLKELHKKLYFKEPGKQKVSMVTWRNRTLGHSCLADNPEKKYSEIPYILEMFKTVGDIGIEYYKKVCLTDGNKNPLRGVALNRTESEVYIQYIPEEDGQASYAEIHNFIAGRDNNLSCFDGFEKGKAYLLNYGNGERYRDQHLSEWLTNCQKTLEEVSARAVLSDEDVFADNLETKDINNLEEQLSAGDDIIGVNFLGRWLMDAVKSCEKGMLLLTAERGLGKSTFCSTVDPFESLEIKYDDEAYSEELEEFLGDVAVRVWHFNSEYRSRKDIFIPGIRDALLTLEPENSNKICGRLESQYNNLVSCAEDLRSLYFTECLNNTMGEYRARTDKQKLLLILDGIDEVSDVGELCSFMPDPARLDEDVCVLLTCRTKQEIKENKQLAEFVESTQFESHLDFTRDKLTITKNTGTETHNENVEYRYVVARYVEAILREQGRTVTGKQVEELAESFEYRFSSLAAYRKLCRLSPAFNDKVGTDLFDAFMHQVEINAPETYVKRLKWILNTLVCAGEPITLRELAFLSGERYISYRLLGMMNDIQAFIKVTRSSRGNCYELSHSQWEEAVKALVPYGDIYFRKQCNELLAEMEVFFNKDNIELILEKTYEGELWLLKNILGIYNRNWKELKENWFEEIRIGSVEEILCILLQNDSFIDLVEKSYLGVQDDSFKRMMQTVSKAYFKSRSNFDYDRSGIRGSKYFEKKDMISPIWDVLEEVYLKIWQGRMNTFERSARFALTYDAAQLLSNQMSVLSDDAIEKKLGLALRYLYRAEENSSYEDNGIEYFDVLLLIAKLRKKEKREKGYEFAKEALLKIIDSIDESAEINIQEGIILAQAYATLGTVYYYEKNNSELDMYFKAYTVLSNLSQHFISYEYLKLKRRVAHLIGDTYKEQNNSIKAIAYWKEALDLTITLPRDEYASKQEQLCYEIGKALIDNSEYLEAVPYLEKAYALCCEYYFDKLSALDALITVFTSLDDYDTVMHYKAIYDPLIQKKKTYANAYKEVLEILKYTEKGAVEKIPNDTLNLFKRLQNPSHTFRCDPTKSLDEQGVMKTTKTILAILFRDYWAYDNQNKRIIEHEERDRMEYRYRIGRELREKASCSIAEMRLENGNYNKGCVEIFWALENIPSHISKQIPIEILMKIKSNMDLLYVVDLSMNGNNGYLKETLEIFSYLVATYIPDYDTLLEEYKKQIPEDFDLAEIFED